MLSQFQIWRYCQDQADISYAESKKEQYDAIDKALLKAKAETLYSIAEYIQNNIIGE